MGPHPDVDLLALHALGEPVLDGAALDHLDGCARCATTVSELAGTVRTARGPAGAGVTDVAPVPVPAHVWQAVSSELGLDPSVRPASVGPSSLRTRGRADANPAREVTAATPAGAPRAGRPRPPVAAPPGATAAAPPVAREPREPRELRDPRIPRRAARGRHGLRLLAVAAAGLVVGVAGTALVTSRPGADPTGTEPAVLAAADLEAFGAGEGTDVQGSARLAARPDPAAADDRVLQVWLDELPDTGAGFFEAWLIDPTTGAMVSLGPVPTGSPGEVTVELAVPRGLDVAVYDLVDVSAEPLDGDPTHSGVSLVRGTLGP